MTVSFGVTSCEPIRLCKIGWVSNFNAWVGWGSLLRFWWLCLLVIWLQLQYVQPFDRWVSHELSMAVNCCCFFAALDSHPFCFYRACDRCCILQPVLCSDTLTTACLFLWDLLSIQTSTSLWSELFLTAFPDALTHLHLCAIYLMKPLPYNNCQPTNIRIFRRRCDSLKGLLFGLGSSWHLLGQVVGFGFWFSLSDTTWRWLIRKLPSSIAAES